MRSNVISCFGTRMARFGKGVLWKPAPTEKITGNLYAIDDQGDVNLFVYKDGEDVLCVDAAWTVTARQTGGCLRALHGSYRMDPRLGSYHGRLALDHERRRL